MCTQRIDHSLQTAVRAAPCSTWTKTPVSVWTVRRRWCWTRLTAVWISVSLPRSTDPAVLRHADPQHRRPGPALATPVLVSGHEHVAAATPDSLRQSYIVTEAEHKLNILSSFVKAPGWATAAGKNGGGRMELQLLSTDLQAKKSSRFS